MTLGGYDTSSHSQELQWVPMLHDSGWYTVKLNDIKIGGQSIGVDAGQVRRKSGEKTECCYSVYC